MINYLSNSGHERIVVVHEGAPFGLHALRIFLPVFKRLESCALTHHKALFGIFTTFLLERPGRRIPEVEEIHDARVRLLIVEEIAVLNVWVRSLLPIHGVCAIDLAVKPLCVEIVCHCVLRGLKTNFRLWHANRDVYDNLRLIFDEF